MTPEKLQQIVDATGLDLTEFAAEIGCSRRLIGYMLVGERSIKPHTVEMVRRATARRIAALKDKISVLERLHNEL